MNEWSFEGNRFRITSDWHLCHRRIPTYCRRLEFMNEGEQKNLSEVEAQEGKIEPGEYRELLRQLRYSKETIDRMNSAIIDNCNATAGPDDVIFIVGDVIFGEINQLRQFRQRIICRHINLIFGNHDKEIKRLWRIGELRDVFDSAQDVARINVDGQGVWLSHYAHVTWDKAHHGIWHCYGHSHGTLEKWREKNMPNARAIDVGIDYRAALGKGYTLWTFPELKRYMDSKNGKPVDYRGSE